MKRIGLFALAALSALVPPALAEEGVRVAGSRLPFVLGGIAVIAFGVFLFIGMLSGHQRREVVVTPTGLPIPMPLIPLGLAVAVGIYLITFTPPDNYVLNGVRYKLSEDGAAAVGFEKGAEVPEVLELPYRVDGQLLKKVGGFAGTGIREVNLPSEVKTIGEGAFKDCASLETVRLAGSLKNPIDVGRRAFQHCASLKTLEGFEHMDEIGMSAFDGCAALELEQLLGGNNHSVTIKAYAFRGCAALRSLTLPCLSEIGNGAFADCPNLERLEMEVAHELSTKAFEGSPKVVVYSNESTVYKARKAGVEAERNQ